jgi:hypothetical protein
MAGSVSFVGEVNGVLSERSYQASRRTASHAQKAENFKCQFLIAEC